MPDVRDNPFPAHHRWMTALTLLLLGAVLAAGLSGMLGGAEDNRSAQGDAADLVIRGPAAVRNGEYLEFEVRMMAHRDIANAALEVDAGFWRNITVNTMIPAPEREEYRNGVMRFEFGPLRQGESAAVKIDGQVNPHRFGPSHGRFALLDGDVELASLDRPLRVVP